MNFNKTRTQLKHTTFKNLKYLNFITYQIRDFFHQYKLFSDGIGFYIAINIFGNIFKFKVFERSNDDLNFNNGSKKSLDSIRCQTYQVRLVVYRNTYVPIRTQIQLDTVGSEIAMLWRKPAHDRQTSRKARETELSPNAPCVTHCNYVHTGTYAVIRST